MDAGKLGIGMIHQHFKLVDVFSAMDNVAMGMEGKRVKPKELKETSFKTDRKIRTGSRTGEKRFTICLSVKSRP